MTALAPHVSAFVIEHLPRDRRASQHTIDSYSCSLLLLAVFASQKCGRTPSQLEVEDLSPELILDFLDALESERGNAVRTRNVRLIAIKSFFRYLEFRSSACLDHSRRVHAIPEKKTDTVLLDWLDRDEMQALVDAPNIATVGGVRDRAMLHLTYSAGLRVSELVSLTLENLAHPHLETVYVMGKGRRERVLPLWKETRAALRSWLKIRPSSNIDCLFLNARGEAMTRHGFAHRLNLHADAAGKKVPSIRNKRITPHVLRRSCAMHTLEATEGNALPVSMWLGHATIASTEMYIRGNSTQKLQVLERNVPPSIKRGAFNGAQDKLIRLLGDPRAKKKC